MTCLVYSLYKCTGKQEQLAHKMKELTVEIRRIKSHGEGKALAEAQEELTETREIKDKVQHDLEKAKKVCFNIWVNIVCCEYPRSMHKDLL